MTIPFVAWLLSAAERLRCRLPALLALTALALTTPASADVFTGTVSMLEVWRNGNVAFRVSPDVSTCNGQFIINALVPGARNQYASVLAAKAAGKQVRVQTAGCGPADNYGGNYNIPEYIYVLD